MGTTFNDLNVLKDTLSYTAYRKIKREYRTSGVKLNIPMMAGASRLTKELKKLGYKIIIITARPSNEYPEINKITNQWLRNTNIEYDSILFDKHKSTKVLEQVPHLAFSINDHFSEAKMISKFGFKTFLLNNKYNGIRENDTIDTNIIRVDKLMDILKYI